MVASKLPTPGNELGAEALALAYAAACLLWMTNRKGGRLVQCVAALGQMALTNYLLQSAILGWIWFWHQPRWVYVCLSVVVLGCGV